MLAGLIIAICVNALVLQQSRHPAPLFRKSFALPASVARPQATKPTANAQPTRDPIDQLLRSTAAPERPGTKESAAAKPLQDAISQLLRSEQAPATENKTILAAQRALIKLGFVVKPDGIVGGATRQAIEQFERDHGLPVQGELSPKVLRELSVRSGIAIE